MLAQLGVKDINSRTFKDFYWFSTTFQSWNVQTPFLSHSKPILSTFVFIRFIYHISTFQLEKKMQHLNQADTDVREENSRLEEVRHK
jgi:hypothetical protein